MLDWPPRQGHLISLAHGKEQVELLMKKKLLCLAVWAVAQAEVRAVLDSFIGMLSGRP